MQITLRKANALQASIVDAMKNVKVQTHVTINEFETPEVKLADANRELFANDQRRSDLLLAQFSIRGLVGAANATSGIDAKLTQAAYIDKRIAQLAELVNADKQLDITVIKGKLDKIRNRKEESRSSLYGRDDDVTTPVQTSEQLVSVKSLTLDLRKQKQKLNDEILELNVRTEIALTDEVVAILKAENLI